MNQSPTQMLIIGLVVAFGVGFVVGSNLRQPSAPASPFPSNFDAAAALSDAKLARQEVSAYQALLTKAIDGCKAPVQETH